MLCLPDSYLIPHLGREFLAECGRQRVVDEVFHPNSRRFMRKFVRLYSSEIIVCAVGMVQRGDEVEEGPPGTGADQLVIVCRTGRPRSLSRRRRRGGRWWGQSSQIVGRNAPFTNRSPKCLFVFLCHFATKGSFNLKTKLLAFFSCLLKFMYVS